MIELRNVSKEYEGRLVLKNLSLSFEEGKAHIILGESGGGKTTLIRLLMGLEKPDSGEITGLSGKRLSAVFQENRLLLNRTVSRNIRMSLEREAAGEEKPGKRAVLSEIEEALSEIGMPGTAGQPVSTLSGGMKRRVAILRAILPAADIYIFDEACQGLDEENRKRVMELILRRTSGKTVFWVTHDREELSYFPGAELLELEKIG